MSLALRISLGIALVQGVVLHELHRLADGGRGPWSDLPFLLPAYAVSIGVPLTWHMLSAQLPQRALAGRVAIVGLALAATGAYVGWVNGPIGDLRSATGGSLFLFACLTLVATRRSCSPPRRRWSTRASPGGGSEWVSSFSGDTRASTRSGRRSRRDGGKRRRPGDTAASRSARRRTCSCRASASPGTPRAPGRRPPRSLVRATEPGRRGLAFDGAS